MKRQFLIVLLIAISNLFSYSQTNTLDVNGLRPGKIYTDVQIRAVLGEPTRYDTWNSEFGSCREYQYGPVNNYDLFRYSGQDGFNEFSLVSSKYSLFGGKLKVGDNISKIYSFGKVEYKAGVYYVDFGWDGAPLEITANSSNIITSIAFSIPI